MNTNNSERKRQKQCVVGLTFFVAFMLWLTGPDIPALSAAMVGTLMSSYMWIWIKPNFKMFLTATLGFWAGAILYETNALHNPYMMTVFTFFCITLIMGYKGWLPNLKRSHRQKGGGKQG